MQVVSVLKIELRLEFEEEILFFKKVYWKADSIWLNDHFVSTNSINEKIFKKYTENQGEEDTGQVQPALDLWSDAIQRA